MSTKATTTVFTLSAKVSDLIQQLHKIRDIKSNLISLNISYGPLEIIAEDIRLEIGRCKQKIGALIKIYLNEGSPYPKWFGELRKRSDKGWDLLSLTQEPISYLSTTDINGNGYIILDEIIPSKPGFYPNGIDSKPAIIKTCRFNIKTFELEEMFSFKFVGEVHLNS